MDSAQGVSVSLIQALQGLSPALDGLGRFISSIGTPGFFILLIPLMYWLVDKKLGKAALFVLLLSAFLGLAFKQLLHQPRPYWLGEIQPLATDSTYGNPSTNASDSFSVLGYLAYRINKEWLWAAAGLSVLLVGFSRLYLGVQFPIGILFGWVIGLGVILAMLKTELATFRWLAHRSTLCQVGMAFGGSLLIILAGFGIRLVIRYTPDPVSWAGFAIQGRSLAEYFTLAGGFWGGMSGYILMQKYANFQPAGRLPAKAGRCLLGFAGMGLIYFSLGWVLSQLVLPESIPAYIVRYIQVGLTVFWIMFASPWLFLKLKLSPRILDGLETIKPEPLTAHQPEKHYDSRGGAGEGT